MKNLIKIATILPYKENYTFSNAQAAAIWVADFYKFSIFKRNNYIFGNTLKKDYLTKNYINIKIENLKSKFSSSTNAYCKNFLEITKKSKFDIIEIHNRPLVFNYIKKNINTKFIKITHPNCCCLSFTKSIIFFIRKYCSNLENIFHKLSFSMDNLFFLSFLSKYS